MVKKRTDKKRRSSQVGGYEYRIRGKKFVVAGEFLPADLTVEG
jgi:hypothetical protein